MTNVTPLTPLPSTPATRAAAYARAMLLCEQASKEQDSAKLAALIAQLCRELDAANGRGRA
jgi:hypothetical protein